MIYILEEYPNGCARPGACYLCGSSKRDGVQVGTRSGQPDLIIDLGRDIEWEGRLCICTECFGDIALQLGYLPPQSDNMGKVNRALGRKVQVLEDRIERLKAMNAELLKMRDEDAADTAES